MRRIIFLIISIALLFFLYSQYSLSWEESKEELAFFEASIKEEGYIYSDEEVIKADDIIKEGEEMDIISPFNSTFKYSRNYDVEEIIEVEEVEEIDKVQANLPNIRVKGVVRGGRGDTVHLEVGREYIRANKGDQIGDLLIYEILRGGVVIMWNEELFIFHIE